MRFSYPYEKIDGVLKEEPNHCVRYIGTLTPKSRSPKKHEDSGYKSKGLGSINHNINPISPASGFVTNQLGQSLKLNQSPSSDKDKLQPINEIIK